ncbi:MAG: fumarylacetoacetate hydrolase family protein [Bacteroidales bacterium]|jgi:2-keto-4-pentenoate hydratase/2-oxohepta-3-ene-1,7-dioic acid hydratase in catechol pathway|nr:fumarylacetoacetate hydrolase family protein [Bacteroidales bacterium]
MKIFAIGWNYPAHNKEMKRTFLSENPIVFMKPDSALLQNGNPFFIPDFSQDVQHEVEIVIKINRLGKNIAERFAYRYYSECTVGIDFTARDLQRSLREQGLPWEISKAFDGAAAIGGFIPVEQFDSMQNIDFYLNKNGITVQKDNTASMLFGIDVIIAWISRFFTVRTGDLIFTGTPAGVGKVEINDHLEGYIQDRKLLDFYVR